MLHIAAHDDSFLLMTVVHTVVNRGLFNNTCVVCTYTIYRNVVLLACRSKPLKNYYHTLVTIAIYSNLGERESPQVTFRTSFDGNPNLATEPYPPTPLSDQKSCTLRTLQTQVMALGQVGVKLRVGSHGPGGSGTA